MEFTPRVLRVFRLADAERLSLKHPCIGSHHLLYGLFLLGTETYFSSGAGGVHFGVALKIGLSAPRLKQAVIDLGPVVERTQNVEGLAFGESAIAVLDRASRSAAAASLSYIGTEHLLLGILSEESGGAATIMAEQKIDVSQARQMILDECGFIQ